MVFGMKADFSHWRNEIFEMENASEWVNGTVMTCNKIWWLFSKHFDVIKSLSFFFSLFLPSLSLIDKIKWNGCCCEQRILSNKRIHGTVAIQWTVFDLIAKWKVEVDVTVKTMHTLKQTKRYVEHKKMAAKTFSYHAMPFGPN